MRQLFPDANESLVPFVDGSGANMNGGDTGYLTAAYVIVQSVLLNVSDKLGNDDVADARQCRVPDKEAASAHGSAHVNGRGEELSGGPVSLSNYRMEILFLLVIGKTFSLDHNFHKTLFQSLLGLF